MSNQHVTLIPLLSSLLLSNRPARSLLPLLSSLQCCLPGRSLPPLLSRRAQWSLLLLLQPCCRRARLWLLPSLLLLSSPLCFPPGQWSLLLLLLLLMLRPCCRHARLWLLLWLLQCCLRPRSLQLPLSLLSSHLPRLLRLPWLLLLWLPQCCHLPQSWPQLS